MSILIIIVGIIITVVIIVRNRNANSDKSESDLDISDRAETLSTILKTVGYSIGLIAIAYAGYVAYEYEMILTSIFYAVGAALTTLLFVALAEIITLLSRIYEAANKK